MKKVFSFLAISVVAGFVLLSGSTIVFASLKDKHSSPKFVTKEARLLQEELAQGHQNMPEQSFMKVNEPIENASESAVLSSECIPKDQIEPEKKYTSLVNFLADNGENTSFEHRQAVASQSGMLDYRGTQAQNDELLKKLLDKQEKDDVCNGVVTPTL